MKSLSLSVLILSVLLSGCGSPDGGTWLVRTVQEDLSVSEAGASWLALDPRGRQGFLEKDDPVGDYILALGRKMIITSEVSSEEYLFSDEITAMKAIWLRSAASQAYQMKLSETTRNSVTDMDLANYRELMGSIVWYTDSQEEEHGPVRLPDLPWEIAFALDSITPGESVTLQDGVFTLDSAVVSPDSMIAVTLADTASVNGFALTSLTESRVSRTLDSISASIEPSITFDSSAVDLYCSNPEGTDPGTILVSWSNGEFTAEDMDHITAFSAIGLPVAPESVPWVTYTLRNQIRLMETEAVLREQYPDSYAGLQVQAEEFAMEQATEALYADMVSSHVEITDQMIQDAFSSLDTIPVIPETRTFESLLVPSGLMDQHLEAIESGADPFQLGQPGLPDFLRSGEDHLSRPVVPGELPPQMATILFLLEPADTGWQRPVEIEPGLFVIYRLETVIPPHEATMAQLEPSLHRNLAEHLEEQRTMDWLRELEQSHQLEINCEIISDLPLDPADWAEL